LIESDSKDISVMTTLRLFGIVMGMTMLIYGLGEIDLLFC